MTGNFPWYPKILVALWSSKNAAQVPKLTRKSRGVQNAPDLG
jgi:hypothetical protein